MGFGATCLPTSQFHIRRTSHRGKIDNLRRFEPIRLKLRLPGGYAIPENGSGSRCVDAALLIDRVLDDEGLTSGLDEDDASTLVQTVARRVNEIARRSRDDAAARRQVEELCRHARQVAEIVATFRAVGELTARSTAARHGLVLPAQINDPTILLRTLLGEWRREGD